mmetsp:Transcript_22589/g.58695  ORF Transcript_22589/g.58695 Transcript_22589/m.58695 type:complete len:115 (-) Transcript_22589:183-527(-)
MDIDRRYRQLLSLDHFVEWGRVTHTADGNKLSMGKARASVHKQLLADEASRTYLADVLGISADPSDTISAKFLTKTMEFLVSRFEYLLMRPDVLFESDDFDFVEVADVDYIGVL